MKNPIEDIADAETHRDKESGGDCPAAHCSSFHDDWLSEVDRLESLQQHLEGIAEKLIEVREELTTRYTAAPGDSPSGAIPVPIGFSVPG